jgi:murein DD-endopeptidase MepM/ murein hydrolase activator NlpD
MTAMGESGLRVLTHGDAVGPDSRGLFQQRDNGAWGTLADRLDPFTSATNFFAKLATISDRESLAPTIVAHRVQVNSDPYHYAKYWDSAVEVVEGLTGVQTSLSSGNGGQVCVSGTTGAGTVSAQGWALPAAGSISSPYGMRFHPIYHVWRLHAGIDIGAGCDDPIYAAQSGTVTATGFGVGYGSNGTIRIDHGGGVQTVYLHEYASGILVHDGQKVTAGQQIGRVGASGDADGCHLHFQVMVNDSPIDPAPFMQDRGVTIGG